MVFSVAAAATERLDRFLADQLDLSRTQAARIVAAGLVRVNGKVARASRVLLHRELIEVEAPDDPPRQLAPPRGDLPSVSVRFEDEHLVVLDKPAGLVVHPAPGHWDDTLVHVLRARGTALSSGAGAPGRPGILHRLDRDTSGLLIVAKTDIAHRRLGAAMAARRVKRAYAALAWGHLDEARLSVDAPLGRHPTDRKRMTVRPPPGGRTARTDLEVVARFSVCDLVRAELHTGRTHQIRVHLAHTGHPVVGDPVYGLGGARRISGTGRVAAERLAGVTPRQALHAAELQFQHPVSGETQLFASEWPADLAPALASAAGQTGVDPQSALAYLGFFRYRADG